MFSVWIILADDTRQQCGNEMMQQSEADNIASELRQMGFVVTVDKWRV